MNDSILTTLVLSSSLLAIVLFFIDSMSYIRNEKLLHIFRTQTMKQIKESSLASRSISLIIGVLLLVLWLLTQGLVARVADSFLLFSRIDQLILVAIQLLFTIFSAAMFLALFSELLLILLYKEKKE